MVNRHQATSVDSGFDFLYYLVAAIDFSVFEWIWLPSSPEAEYQCECVHAWNKQGVELIVSLNCILLIFYLIHTPAAYCTPTSPHIWSQQTGYCFLLRGNLEYRLELPIRTKARRACMVAKENMLLDDSLTRRGGAREYQGEIAYICPDWTGADAVFAFLLEGWNDLDIFKMEVLQYLAFSSWYIICIIFMRIITWNYYGSVSKWKGTVF